MVFYFCIAYLLLWAFLAYRWNEGELYTDFFDGYCKFAFFVVILFIVNLTCGHANTDKIQLEPEVNPIYSLKTIGYDDLNGGGSFIGWTISSSGGESYVVMHKETKGFKKTFLDASNTYINETDDQPSVSYPRHQHVCHSKFWNVPWMWNYKGRICTSKRGVTINVPYGTVIQKIDQIQ